MNRTAAERKRAELQEECRKKNEVRWKKKRGKPRHLSTFSKCRVFELKRVITLNE